MSHANPREPAQGRSRETRSCGDRTLRVAAPVAEGGGRCHPPEGRLADEISLPCGGRWLVRTVLLVHGCCSPHCAAPRPRAGCPCWPCSSGSGSHAMPKRAPRWTGATTSSLRALVPRPRRPLRNALQRRLQARGRHRAALPRRHRAALPRRRAPSRDPRRPSGPFGANAAAEGDAVPVSANHGITGYQARPMT